MPPSPARARRAAPTLPHCGPRTALLQSDIAALATAGHIAAIELREVETNGPGRRLPAPIYYIAVELAERADSRTGGRWRYLTTRRELFAPRRFHRIEVANRVLRDIAPDARRVVVPASRLPPSALE